MGNQYHSLFLFLAEHPGSDWRREVWPRHEEKSYEFPSLTRELGFTVTILCGQQHCACFQSQPCQGPAVTGVVRAKGSLTHEPHQLVVGLHMGPLHSHTRWTFPLLGGPGPLILHPRPRKWDTSVVGKEDVL